MSQQRESWPLAMSEQESALAAMAGLVVSQPYGGLSSDAALAALATPAVLEPMIELVPDFRDLLSNGGTWELLGRISAIARAMPPGRREVMGLELVLGDEFMPSTAEVEESLYWRRVDVGLEALSTESTAGECVDAVLGQAQWLAEESKSGLKSILTSEDLLNIVETTHEMQAYITGVYVPYASDAIRWGQRKLDKVGDADLLWSVAADLTRLRLRAALGDIEPVREYGRLLTEDITVMSASHAHLARPDQRAKQIRLFTAALRYVADLLGEDGDGLATDSAPSFEGMRLSEVREMASAMGVTLAEHDGNFNGVAENSERRILQASNWYVKRQFPAPGTQLERMRRVRVWVLKHGENDLSHHQSLAYLKAIGQG